MKIILTESEEKVLIKLEDLEYALVNMINTNLAYKDWQSFIKYNQKIIIKLIEKGLVDHNGEITGIGHLVFNELFKHPSEAIVIEDD